ncbi:glycosyltransferase family 4 protein [Phycicoccus sp. Soil748]|uniref:glycosyltransferase family 4 protein n=1 Tax=Phycicoccus sp. Soil748 TaxID=1736397 RepID=UPI0009EA101F
MKILRIAERTLPLRGGKEVHVAELTRAQVAMGHEVTLLYSAGDGGLDGQSQQIMLPSVARQFRGLSRTFLFAAAATRHMSRGYDLIHAHGDLAEAWWISRRWSPAAPTVLTVHGQLNPRYSRLSRLAFRNIGAFIALGDNVHEDLLGCGVPDSRIVTMSSGVNRGMLAAVEAPRKPGHITCVGSLDAVKNVETVIAAVRSLPTNILVHLDIIGDGPLRQQLEIQAAGDPRISFHGQLPRERVYEHVQASDLFIIASRRLASKGEGVPTALLEAMALGTACLVSSEATPGSAIPRSDSYVVFDPLDTKSLSDLILRCLTDAEQLRRLGTLASEAVAHLDWPNQAQRVMGAYERAIEHHSAVIGRRQNWSHPSA